VPVHQNMDIQKISQFCEKHLASNL